MYKTLSAEATQEIAKDLAQKIIKNGPRVHATVIALVGDLGAGKTTFVQGFAEALGIRDRVASPTFLILKRYPILNSKYSNLYHIDAYRLDSSSELLDLGLSDLLKSPENIIIIEWADKVRDILLSDVINIKFRHGVIDNERELSLE